MADKGKTPEAPELTILRMAKEIDHLEKRIDFYDFLYRQGKHNGPVPKKSVARAYWRYTVAWSNYRIRKIIYPDDPIQLRDAEDAMRMRHESYLKVKRKVQSSRE